MRFYIPILVIFLPGVCSNNTRFVPRIIWCAVPLPRAEWSLYCPKTRGVANVVEMNIMVSISDVNIPNRCPNVLADGRLELTESVA